MLPGILACRRSTYHGFHINICKVPFDCIIIGRSDKLRSQLSILRESQIKLDASRRWRVCHHASHETRCCGVKMMHLEGSMRDLLYIPKLKSREERLVHLIARSDCVISCKFLCRVEAYATGKRDLRLPRATCQDLWACIRKLHLKFRLHRVVNSIHISNMPGSFTSNLLP